MEWTLGPIIFSPSTSAWLIQQRREAVGSSDQIGVGLEASVTRFMKSA